MSWCDKRKVKIAMRYIYSPELYNSSPSKFKNGFQSIGCVAEAVVVSAARRAIKQHRQCAARLSGNERRLAISEANAIAQGAGLIGEGEAA